MKLSEWLALQPVASKALGSNVVIPDSGLVNRPGAWALVDYQVSSAIGGSLWFSIRRHGVTAQVSLESMGFAE